MFLERKCAYCLSIRSNTAQNCVYTKHPHRRIWPLLMGRKRWISLSFSAGTKEDAFTHAIIAAGIAHSVARALSSGNFTLPGEKSDTKNSINNGIQLAKEFLDGQDSKNQEIKLMNSHNNEVGLAVSGDKITWFNTFSSPSSRPNGNKACNIWL